MRNSLQPDHLTVKLTGSAGQALGILRHSGLKIEGQVMQTTMLVRVSGGIISVRPPMVSPLVAAENTIIGNTVLYGATDGYLFAAGRAGERFAVRNSGAKVVVEGCGSNGCEYMTGGIAVILGTIGANFGAGMTGGMAYLYNPEGQVDDMLNMESLVTGPVAIQHWEINCWVRSNAMSKKPILRKARKSCVIGIWKRRTLFKSVQKRCWIKFPSIDLGTGCGSRRVKRKNGRIMRPFLLGLMTLNYSGHDVVLSLLYAIRHDIA